jgi:hypothetical protein
MLFRIKITSKKRKNDEEGDGDIGLKTLTARPGSGG